MAKLDVKKDFPFHPLFINITSLAQIFSNVEPLSYIHTQPEKICLCNSSGKNFICNEYPEPNHFDMFDF